MLNPFETFLLHGHVQAALTGVAGNAAYRHADAYAYAREAVRIGSAAFEQARSAASDMSSEARAVDEQLLKECQHVLTTYQGLWATDQKGELASEASFKLDDSTLLSKLDARLK